MTIAAAMCNAGRAQVVKGAKDLFDRPAPYEVSMRRENNVEGGGGGGIYEGGFA